MGLSIEQQRERIRAEKKQKGELVSVGKVHVFKTRKKKDKKTKQPKLKKSNKIKSKVMPAYRKKYNDYLLSDEWAQLRIDLFNNRGYCCERCTNNKSLHVHHLHYDNIFNEEPEDLIILCPKCHKLEHKRLKSETNN